MKFHNLQSMKYSGCAAKHGLLALALTWPLVGFGASAPETVVKSPYTLAQNPSVTRWASGTILFRSIKDSVVRGYEDWHLTVYSDGRRSLSARESNLAVGGIRESIYIVDSNFQPMSAYEQLWVAGLHRGTGLFTVRDDALQASVYREGSGQLMQTIDVPKEFAIVVHSLATDGWIGSRAERRPGLVSTMTAYVLEPWGNSPGSLIGSIKQLEIKFVGTEEVIVPAGRFSTDHFRIVNYKADLWITGQDRMLVRYAYLEDDREYVLAKWDSGAESLASRDR